LYRAIDRDDNLVDTMLSTTRDLAAAKAIFKQATATVGHKPDRVTTDKHGSYPRAVRQSSERKVRHRTSQYLNNIIKQDHRGVKSRCYAMRGFGSVTSAARFCTAFDELRQYFNFRAARQKPRPLSDQRYQFRQRFNELRRYAVEGRAIQGLSK